MEIWKEKAFDQGIVWDKKPFRTERSTEAVDNFFKPSFPPLSYMVLEELKKEDGRRWIVLSKKENAKLLRFACCIMTPEHTVGSASFLNTILKPVKDCYRALFFATLIREDSPAKSLFEKGAPLRLAIQIEE